MHKQEVQRLCNSIVNRQLVGASAFYAEEKPLPARRALASGVEIDAHLKKPRLKRLLKNASVASPRSCERSFLHLIAAS
jgi:hypothetical protein